MFSNGYHLQRLTMIVIRVNSALVCYQAKNRENNFMLHNQKNMFYDIPHAFPFGWRSHGETSALSLFVPATRGDNSTPPTFALATFGDTSTPSLFDWATFGDTSTAFFLVGEAMEKPPRLF